MRGMGLLGRPRPPSAIFEARPRGDGVGAVPAEEETRIRRPASGPRGRRGGKGGARSRDSGGLRGPGERLPELTPNPEVAPGGYLGYTRARQFPKTFRLEGCVASLDAMRKEEAAPLEGMA